MTKRTLAILAAAMFCLTVAPLANASGIVWAPSFHDAQKESAATGKIMMVDFYTDWCVWCKTLDKKVYPDPRVVAAASAFIPVKVNAEKGGDFIAAAYGVTSYPDIVFMDSDGNVEDTIPTYAPPLQFSEMLRAVQHDIVDFRALEAQAATNPNNPNLAAHLAAAYAARGRLKDAIEQVGVSEANGGSKNLPRAYNAVGDALVLQQQDHDAAVYYQKSLKIESAAEDLVSSYMGLAQTSADRGDKAGLLQQLKLAAAVPGILPSEKKHVNDIIKQVEASS